MNDHHSLVKDSLKTVAMVSSFDHLKSIAAVENSNR